jgi:hypothetical protein
MKHQIDETSNWWNIKKMKNQSDETSNRWNIKSMKHQIDETSNRLNIKSMKHQSDKTLNMDKGSETSNGDKGTNNIEYDSIKLDLCNCIRGYDYKSRMVCKICSQVNIHSNIY